MNKYNIYAFADESSPMIDGQIDAMKRNDIMGLEIRNVDNVNISDIPLEKAKEVKKKLDDNGLITWSIGSPLGKIDIEKDDFSAHLEKLKHTLEVADILAANKIRMFSFYIPEGKNPFDYKNKVIENLGQMLEISKNTGISLYHENEKGIYGDIAVRCADIYKALPDLKGIFDPANFVQSGQDTLEAWEILNEYIGYMHIKDSLNDGNVVPAGMGDGNLVEIIKMYINKGGNFFTLEPHLTVFSGLSALEREGEKSKVSHKFTYDSEQAAFDAASQALKIILEKM